MPRGCLSGVKAVGVPGSPPQGPGLLEQACPLAACHLLGIMVPFVLILVDISFHTLLNEPLQKG